MLDLKQMIVDAFRDVRYPGDDNLLNDVSSRSPNWKYVGDSDVWQLLHGKMWQDMPVREFLFCDTPVPDLRPAAFQFYMPALLLASLDESLDVSVDIALTLAFYLAPSSAVNDTGPSFTRYNDKGGFKKRIATFSNRQKEVMILVFKEHVRRGNLNEDDVAAAIQYLEAT